MHYSLFFSFRAFGFLEKRKMFDNLAKRRMYELTRFYMCGWLDFLPLYSEEQRYRKNRKFLIFLWTFEFVVIIGPEV